MREKTFQPFSATTSKPESIKFQCTYYFRIWTVGNLADLKSGSISSCLVKYFILGNRTGRFVTTLTSAWRSFMLENSSLENIDLHLLEPTCSVSCYLMTHDFLRNQTVNDREVLFFGHFSWPTRYCRSVFVLATASAVDQRSELYLQLSLLLPILISDLSFR